MKQKISVLCAVREDSVFRALMREMDDGERCTFCIVHGGAQAYRIAAADVPDVLIVDAILPGMDGLALVSRLRACMGNRMPRVIGGAMMPFARDALMRHGVSRIAGVPWRMDEVRGMLLSAFEEIDSFVDWNRAQEGYLRAEALLEQLGMRTALRGYAYLSWAAALAAINESRLYAIGERIYRPIAAAQHTTPQNVERLIRHAIESTMDAVGAKALYAFFGNTIDPARGKPTNAQMIAELSQRVKVSAANEAGSGRRNELSTTGL